METPRRESDPEQAEEIRSWKAAAIRGPAVLLCDGDAGLALDLARAGCQVAIFQDDPGFAEHLASRMAEAPLALRERLLPRRPGAARDAGGQLFDTICIDATTVPDASCEAALSEAEHLLTPTGALLFVVPYALAAGKAPHRATFLDEMPGRLARLGTLETMRIEGGCLLARVLGGEGVAPVGPHYLLSLAETAAMARITALGDEREALRTELARRLHELEEKAARLAELEDRLVERDALLASAQAESLAWRTALNSVQGR